MRDMFFNGMTINVEGTEESYHTLNDWGLYVSNTDYIKEPKQYTKYIEIPGRNGLLDVSEVVAGRQIYTSRQIEVELSGIREKKNWDSVMSSFRNKINGKVCRIIFDNDRAHYWRGRITIKDFSSLLRVGTFKIDIPNADPYKYELFSSTEPWLWDPFNFETGIITYIGAITVSGSETVTLPHGHMPTCPDFVVSNKTSSTFTVTYGSETFELSTGSNKIPSIYVGGDDDVELTFTGSAIVEIVYRSGSL